MRTNSELPPDDVFSSLNMVAVWPEYLTLYSCSYICCNFGFLTCIFPTFLPWKNSLNNFSYPKKPPPMETLTGQQPKDKLVVHGNKSATANWWTKTAKLFQEIFGIFRDISKFLLICSTVSRLFGKRRSKFSTLRYSQIYGTFRLFSAPLLHLVPKETIKIPSMQIVDSEINKQSSII